MTGVSRWAAVCAAARERGIDAAGLEGLVLAPISAGGAGWKWWQPHKTTEALAAWLLRRLPAPAPPTRQEGPMGNELELVVEQDREYLPALTIEGAVKRHQMLREFVSKLMQPGADYGKIPGTEKNTLLKPGAEKLCTFFGLRKQVEIIKEVEDWTGKDHAGEPFFYYMYRVHLYRGDSLIASGDGSANSWEKKYRWRAADRACPQCGAAAIKRSKFPPRDRPEEQPGWYCFAKAGGCGANFDFGDPAVSDQKGGKVPNPDVADCVNSIQKIALKRALVAATLLGVNASDYFTQDVEDGYDDAAHDTPAAAREEPAPPAGPRARKAPGPAMPATAAELKARLDEKDLALEKAGLIEAGDLLAAVHQAVTGRGLGESLAALDPQHVPAVVAIASKLVAGYEAKKPRPAGVAP